MEKIKVLMIDDNVNLIEMVEDYFEDNSKIEIVGKAYDGEEGLKIIKEGTLKYDLIILDLIMPKKDGMSVLKELKELNINSYEDFRQKATEKFNFAIYEGFADSKTCAIWNFDFTEADHVAEHMLGYEITAGSRKNRGGR